MDNIGCQGSNLTVCKTSTLHTVLSPWSHYFRDLASDSFYIPILFLENIDYETSIDFAHHMAG